MNETVQVSMFDLASFAAAVASLVLAVIAIWITLHFKKEADRVNDSTRDLLTEIKTVCSSGSLGISPGRRVIQSSF